MSRQLSAWQGEFGTAYTERNVPDWRRRLGAFREMLAGLELSSVLEVGCNRGHNLVTLSELLGDEVDLVGVEPNRHALAIARTASPKIATLRGDVFDLPFKDGRFDLVFTAGVLIHVALGDLPRALREICRVSRRHVLAIEYFAEEETVIPYRGHDDLLWKRDFLAHYRRECPDLRPVRQGYWGPEAGFDRTHWWLLEREPETGRP